MYRKESCPTLLKSLDSDEGYDEGNEDNKSDARKMKWHKVINYYYYFIIIHRVLVLLAKLTNYLQLLRQIWCSM
jgi:hypothetical protein